MSSLGASRTPLDSITTYLAGRFSVSELTHGVALLYSSFSRQDILSLARVGILRDPRRLLGYYEQIVILQIILARPDICLSELQDELFSHFGIPLSVPTIRRTLKAHELY